jgi:parvulin-like peptidyl-prolyl isomerase
MKPLHLTFLAALAALTLAVSGCGGESGVPEGAVAVVDGTEIPESDLDILVEQAKRQYGAQFPKAGTPEYQDLRKQYVAGLVQNEWFAQEAEGLGLEVSDKEVDTELDKFVKSRFDGKQAELEKALKEQNFPMEALRDSLHDALLSQKLFEEVTKDVKVPQSELLAYYEQNSAQYSTPESRDVRHILISEKSANGEVDFAKSKTEADRIYSELRNGGDFAALAKAESADTVSAKDGGKLTVSKGQTVPEFDKWSFEAKVGDISQPIKTTYGYHVIEALSPVRDAAATPFKKVRASIQATLLQDKKTTFMNEWAADVRDKYEGKTQYAAGLQPPELPEEPTDTTETETTPGSE